MSLLESLFSTHGKLLGMKQTAQASAMQPLLERIQAMEAERQRAQQAQAGQDQLEAYRGILANPDLTPAGAGNLAGLLGSKDPNARASGQALIDSYLGQRSPQGRANLAATQAGTAQQVQATEQAGIMGPLQERAARLGIAGAEQGLKAGRQQMDYTALQMAGQRLANQKAMLEASKPRPVLPYGEPPKGMYPALNPGGQIEYIPHKNSAQWNASAAALRATEQGVEALQDFMQAVDKVGPTGTELVGGDANTLRFLRGNVSSKVALARNLGVINPGEQEAIDKQLPDPTGIPRNIAAFISYLDQTGASTDLARSSIMEPYEAFLKQLEEQLKIQRQTYWYLPAQPILPEDARGNQ